MRRASFGSYEIIHKLAQGGMATTYLARKLGEAGFERIVVLKRIRQELASEPGVRDAIRDEARIAASIHHPNVVHVEDVIEADTELGLVMPYVESVSLGALLASAPSPPERALPPPIAIRILLDVLAALEAAHEARDLRGEPLGLVHRDVSPKNVLVGADGVARLIDFGVAMAQGRLGQTQSGIMKGTLAYMSPEQLRRREMDRRSDVFAAGSVLFEALVGKRLFEGRDEADILIAILADEIPTLEGRVSGVTSALDAVLVEALARDPDERFASARAFAEALEKAVTPASAKEVALVVKERAGAELEARRDAIKVFLERTSKEPAVESPKRSRKALALAGTTPLVALGLMLLLKGSAKAPPRLLPSQGILSAETRALIAQAEATKVENIAPLPTSTSEVKLSLSAPFVIQDLKTAGLLRSELSGTTASLWVSPWVGTLLVDVTLVGGKRALAQFDAGSTRAVALAMPEARAPLASSRSDEEVRPRTKEGKRTPNELQDNPYR